jgi:Flp pilus assembly protein TadG
MPISSQREQGQVIVMFALSLVALMAMLSLVFDVGNQLIQRRVAQNAADAGALAGVQILALPGATPTSIYNTIMTYVEGNSGPWTTTTATTSLCTTPVPDVCVSKLSFLKGDGTVQADIVNGSSMPFPRPFGIRVEVTRTVPATFAQLVGIPKLTSSGSASATAGNGPADIILAFDTTGSMGVHIADEQQAASTFITMMNVTTDPNSVQIGLVRFQGTHQNGTWVDNGHWVVDHTVKDGTLADYDWTADGQAAVIDATVLTRLNSDPAALLKLVADTGPGTCPALPSSLAGETYKGVSSAYACGLKNVSYQSSAPIGTTKEIGGTRLPNAFDLVLGRAGNAGFNAWDPSYGGRINARNVMIMMTDGLNNCGSPCSAPNTNAAWDALARADADEIRLGPDHIAGTIDDVEIYTVGYFGGSESGIANDSPAIPYVCPGPDWDQSNLSHQTASSVGASNIDVLLHDISSSSPGTCDHYVPLKKSDDLPEVFRTLAGRVLAGRISN